MEVMLRIEEQELFHGPGDAEIEEYQIPDLNDDFEEYFADAEADEALLAQLNHGDYRPSVGAPERICAICRDTIQIGAQLSYHKCRNIFHLKCLGKWVASSNTCPLCRASVIDD